MKRLLHGHLGPLALADLQHKAVASADSGAAIRHFFTVDLHTALINRAVGLAGGVKQTGCLDHHTNSQMPLRRFDRHFRNIARHGTGTEAGIELRFCGLGGSIVVETAHDFLGEQYLCIARVATFGTFLLQAGDLIIALKAQKVIPVPHQRIGNAHHLAEHFIGFFRDADVVVLALAHLDLTVKADKQRHRENALCILTVLTLKLTTDKQVKALVGAAEFEVGLQSNRVITLHKRVEKFVHGDRRLFGEALGKVIALEQTGERVTRGELNQTDSAERIAPFGVVAHFSTLDVEHMPGLGKIGLGIGHDLLMRERRTRGISAGRVTNGGREVTDQENHRVAHVLKLAKLVEHNRVTDMNVRRSRVKTQFAAKRNTRGFGAGEFLQKLLFDQKSVSPAADKGHLFTDLVSYRVDRLCDRFLFRHQEPSLAINCDSVSPETSSRMKIQTFFYGKNPRKGIFVTKDCRFVHATARHALKCTDSILPVFNLFRNPNPMTATSLFAGQLTDASKTLLGGLRSVVLSAAPRFAVRSGLSLALAATLGAGLFTTAAPAHAYRLLDEIVSQKEFRPVSNPALDALRSLDVTERNITVNTGDTLLSLYGRLGINDPEVIDLIRSRRELRPFAMPQPGQFVTAGVYADGHIAYLRMYLEGPHERDSRVIEVVRDGAKLTSSNQPFVFDVIEETASGRYEGSLESTAEALDIPDNVLAQLDNIWESEHSPIAKLRKGDMIQVAYERKYADGHFIRNAQLLAVRLQQGKKVTEALWYPEFKTYYTADGESVKQTFLRVPLDVKEVSSEFAPLRRHPITGKLRPHNGTDFRAPKGSRIFAAADGVVTFVGFQRRGYGRYIKIDHGQNRETVYAHLSAFASGLKNGQTVHKGDVIGFVGRSGLATGNHLHYELIVDGVQVNPLTADLPDTQKLSPYQLARLKTSSQPLLERFAVLAKGNGNASRQPLLNTAEGSAGVRSDLSFRSSFPARAVVRTRLAQKNAAQDDSVR